MNRLKRALIPLLILLLPASQTTASVVPDPLASPDSQTKTKKRLDLSTLRLNRFVHNGNAFMFLVHGSHSSHASHSSHSSHVSSSYGSSYGGSYSSSGSSASPSPVAPSSENTTATVIKRANLRSGASARYSVLTIVDEGLVVSVLEERDGWSHVKFELKGLIYDGWISSEMLMK